MCESIWEENLVTSEELQMVQFVGALHKRELTWYMPYMEKTTNANKEEIKQQFMSFFRRLMQNI